MIKDEYFYDCVGEFLETSFHCILYIRGVYPSNLFSKSIKYDIPVPISRSDILSRYISNAIDSLKPNLIKDTIEKISLTILNKHDKPIEKFIFKISPTPITNYNIDNSQTVIDEDTDTSNFYIYIQNNLKKSNNNNNNKSTTTTTTTTANTEPPNLVQLEASFKSYIMKLLMTTDSFYNPSFYKTKHSTSSDTSYSTASSSFGGDGSTGDDGVIHFNIKDDENLNYYKPNTSKKETGGKGNGDEDKELKFTIHIYTKQQSNNNSINLNLLNPNLSNVLLNINPLESPHNTNYTVNQITPVWISTTNKQSEIENSFVIPLNSNITDEQQLEQQQLEHQIQSNVNETGTTTTNDNTGTKKTSKKRTFDQIEFLVPATPTTEEATTFTNIPEPLVSSEVPVPKAKRQRKTKVKKKIGESINIKGARYFKKKPLTDAIRENLNSKRSTFLYPSSSTPPSTPYKSPSGVPTSPSNSFSILEYLIDVD